MLMVRQRRIRITRTIQTDAPVDEVFRTVSNPENILNLNLVPEGSPIKMHSVERITRGPIGIGSIWHFQGSFSNRVAMEYDEQIKVWDPPRRLVTEQIGGGPFRAIRWEHRMSQEKSGRTRETCTVEYEPPDSVRMPVDRKNLRKLLSESMETALDRLKMLLERKKSNEARKMVQRARVVPSAMSRGQESSPYETES